MKKLSKLKLNVLSDANLLDREMNILRGGDHSCTCSCYYANNGGSSSSDNSKANYNSATQNYSSQGNNCTMYGCNDSYTQCGFSDATH
jgi:natural product precursor